MQRGVGPREKNQSQMQNTSVKRPFQQMDREHLVIDRGDPIRLIGAPMAKHSFQPSFPRPVCNYRLKPGHTQCNCRLAKRLCLICGSEKHSIGDCPLKVPGYAAPVRTTLLAPPIRRNPRPLTEKLHFLHDNIL